MSHLYAIVEKSGDHWSVLHSLGGSRGINEDLILKCGGCNDFNNVWKPSYGVLPLASVIFTRHRDSKRVSHELNKLYHSLAKYKYFLMTYEQANSLESKSEIDMNQYEVSEEEFIKTLYSSEMFNVILEASKLTKRAERKPVIVNLSIDGRLWCFTTDLYKPSKKYQPVEFEIPLHVTTDNVRDYITQIIGLNYGQLK